MSQAHPDHDHADTHAEHHEEHHYNYVLIWGILLVLLLISIAGPTLEIKAVTLVTAFGIAFVKAFVVVKYFMHLTIEKRIIHYAFITSLVLMLLFFAAVAPDVMNHKGTNWTNLAAGAAVERGIAEGDNAPAHGDAAADGAHGDAPAHDAAAPAEH